MQQIETVTKNTRMSGGALESDSRLAPTLTALTLGILIALPTALPAQGIASSRTLFDGFTSASPASVSDDDEQEEKGRSPATYALAGSARRPLSAAHHRCSGRSLSRTRTPP